MHPKFYVSVFFCNLLCLYMMMESCIIIPYLENYDNNSCSVKFCFVTYMKKIFLCWYCCQHISSLTEHSIGMRTNIKLYCI